jgi:hypothetical protein
MINSQSLGRIVAGAKTKMLFISCTQRVAAQLFILHSEAGFICNFYIARCGVRQLRDWA